MFRRTSWANSKVALKLIRGFKVIVESPMKDSIPNEILRLPFTDVIFKDAAQRKDLVAMVDGFTDKKITFSEVRNFPINNNQI